MSAWFANEDISYLKSDSIFPILKVYVPDSQIVRDTKMKRTVTIGIIEFVLALYKKAPSFITRGNSERLEILPY